MVNLVSEFSLDEENELLQHIIKNNHYSHLHKDQFWKDVVSSGKTERTWQDVKQHFQNKIIHKLKHPYFKLKQTEIDCILRATSCTTENISNDKTIESKHAITPEEKLGKKIIVITRRKNNANIYPNYRTQGNKRILVSRNNNPSPDMDYAETNSEKPKKTIVAHLCSGKKKEIFVVRPKDEEPFERYGTVPTTSQMEHKPPKKLICFSYTVS